MRRLLALLSTIGVLACSSAPATRSESPQQKAQIDPTVEYLLTSAATDFQNHRPPYPVQFRDVRSGYVTNADGTKQYRLCGEFLPARESGKAEWMQFVTIKTSGYEQYVGGQGAHFCKDSMTW